MALQAIGSSGLGISQGGTDAANLLQPATGPAPSAPAVQSAPAYYGGGYSTGGGGGSSAAAAPAPVVDPSIYAYYDNLTANVNSQLGQLPYQQQVAQQNINDAYQTSANQMNTDKNIANRNYTQNKADDLQNETTQLGNIQFQTGQQTNALERLLGSAGFGSSAVAQQGVPYATGLVGQQQSGQVSNTFAKNSQALDQNWGDYNNKWNTSFGDLGHQRDVQNNALQASIDSNKASLLSQLASIAQQRAAATPGSTYSNVIAASAPIEQQVNSLGSQITGLGQQYAHPITPTNTPAYQAPALSNYMYNNAPTPTINGAPGAASNLGSFTNLLLDVPGGQQQNQQQQQTNLAGQPA